MSEAVWIISLIIASLKCRTSVTKSGLAARPPIGVRFRDYAIALSDGLAKTKAYQKDVDHWMGRLDGLPGPPALPLLLGDGGGGGSGATGRFLHIAGAIDRDQWRNLRRLCAKHKMTATATLCSVFALALAAWAPNSRDADGKVLINVADDFATLPLTEAYIVARVSR